MPNNLKKRQHNKPVEASPHIPVASILNISQSKSKLNLSGGGNISTAHAQNHAQTHTCSPSPTPSDDYSAARTKGGGFQQRVCGLGLLSRPRCTSLQAPTAITNADTRGNNKAQTDRCKIDMRINQACTMMQNSTGEKYSRVSEVRQAETRQRQDKTRQEKTRQDRTSVPTERVPNRFCVVI